MRDTRILAFLGMVFLNLSGLKATDGKLAADVVAAIYDDTSVQGLATTVTRVGPGDLDVNIADIQTKVGPGAITTNITTIQVEVGPGAIKPNIDTLQQTFSQGARPLMGSRVLAELATDTQVEFDAVRGAAALLNPGGAGGLLGVGALVDGTIAPAIPAIGGAGLAGDNIDDRTRNLLRLIFRRITNSINGGGGTAGDDGQGGANYTALLGGLLTEDTVSLADVANFLLQVRFK